MKIGSLLLIGAAGYIGYRFIYTKVMGQPFTLGDTAPVTAAQAATAPLVQVINVPDEGAEYFDDDGSSGYDYVSYPMGVGIGSVRSPHRGHHHGGGGHHGGHH